MSSASVMVRAMMSRLDVVDEPDALSGEGDVLVSAAGQDRSKDGGAEVGGVRCEFVWAAGPVVGERGGQDSGGGWVVGPVVGGRSWSSS